MVFLSDDESVGDSDGCPDVTVNIQELDDVLMKDVGNKIADSGKYVLLIFIVDMYTWFMLSIL